eukprot:6932754-Lingulodinium_polyedra.AAC.1
MREDGAKAGADNAHPGAVIPSAQGLPRILRCHAPEELGEHRRELSGGRADPEPDPLAHDNAP